ncbi:MAG TPA: LAGLIDADG family homing endonuclease, partial [Chloroflexaceae bacterium]|nr:LAGLIDADG family homing endonuclease [Chloroflexaceae bacterium]
MHLKRLEIQGFKTFAGRTVLEFRPGITAVVGPNGSGKCVTHESRVTLSDGQEVMIGELVNRALNASASVEVLEDGWMTRENPDRVHVLSLNPRTFKLEPRPVAGFVKRAAPPQLLRIHTRSGRAITATPYHPLFTLAGGELRAMRADEVRAGVRVAVVRRLPTRGLPAVLDPTAIARTFSEEDGVFVPPAPDLRAWAERGRKRFGSYVAWRRDDLVPGSQMSGMLSGQSVNVGVLNRLADSAGLAPPLDGHFQGRGRTQIRLPGLLTPGLARLLGLLIAEGVNRSTDQVRFVNDDPAVGDLFSALAQGEPGVTVFRKRYKARAEDFIISSRALSVALERLFGFAIDSRSAAKVVPPQLLSSPPHVQWAFLSGLFEGDAHIHLRSSAAAAKSQPYIEYATASERLARGVVSLLLQRGIFATLRAKVKRATNSPTPTARTYYSVYVYGTEQLRHIAEHLTFVGAKAEALQMLRGRPPAANPNLDLVPGVTPLVREAARLAGVSVKRHRAGRAKLAAYCEGRCEASRPGLLEVVAQIEALGVTPARAAPILSQLSALADSDAYWDEVVAVEAVPPDDPWVYDLSVAETHNFVAENIIVHNSNLADAVRWALGEQSLAQLRCKRSEELIYSGGGRRAAAGLAEVSLTVDNSDRLLPLDFDEVTITRRATRAGDSEYFINRARVRLRDVLEATEPLGGSYTIINQGLVDAALTLRPEERRRLFEDAAEIGGFELRKAEAARRLRETEGNLNRLADLLAELEPRLRALKRQAAQARQHRELAAELHRLQTRHYAAQWRAAQALVAGTRAGLERLEAELARARAAQSAAGAALQALRAGVRARRDDLGRLHQESSELHRRAESAQRELAVGAERVAAIARRGEDFDRQRNDLALRREQAEAQRAEAAADLARAEAELAARRAELSQAEAERAGLEQARGALADELRRSQDVALRAAAAAAEARSRGEQLAAEAERLARESAELDAAVAQAEARVAGARAQVEAARAQLEAAEAARTAAAAAEGAARHELDELRAARAQADEERAAARRALADAEARLDSLGRLARSYAGAFAGVRAAMQWAERAGRGGFALVQSIVRTPAALETAVEVALGSRLQNIVVERWEDAEEAIAELRRGGAGRATFMPLDTIRAPGDDRRRDDDRGRADGEVLGVAADLVESDERYAPVVRQLLGRVLVVRDLPTARAELRRLAGGWTIVTLGGEQVNSGGSLTGGAQTKESGALRREPRLRELPGQVGAARAALAAAEARRAELEAR